MLQIKSDTKIALTFSYTHHQNEILTKKLITKNCHKKCLYMSKRKENLNVFNF